MTEIVEQSECAQNASVEKKSGGEEEGLFVLEALELRVCVDRMTRKRRASELK